MMPQFLNGGALRLSGTHVLPDKIMARIAAYVSGLLVPNVTIGARFFPLKAVFIRLAVRKNSAYEIRICPRTYASPREDFSVE